MTDDINKYVGFPYMTPIDPIIAEELNSRSKSIIPNVINPPWTEVTSGAIGNNSQLKTLNSNATNIKQIYYNGVPIPGVISVDVKYLTEYGGVREANIHWRANSIQQLEEYGPYFLSPGMSILLEWGRENSKNIYKLNNYDIISDVNLIWKNLYNRTIESNGNYDAMFGVTIGYSVDPNGSGFDCTTTIHSISSLMYGISIDNEYSDDIENENPYKNTIANYVENKLDEVVTYFLKNNYEHVYQDVDNKQIFVTWDFIENKIVNNNVLLYNSDESALFTLYSKTINDKKEESIKISNHELLRSTDLTVCILPNKTQYDRRVGGTTNLKLNNLSFPSEDERGYFDYSGGQLQNIFVNLNIVKESFKNSIKLIDAITTMLNKINGACSNYWNFKIKACEHINAMMIIDENYTHLDIKKTLEDNNNTKYLYEFKYYGGKGIINSVSCNISLNEQLGMQAMFDTNNQNASIEGRSHTYNIWNSNKIRYKDYFFKLQLKNANNVDLINATVSSNESGVDIKLQKSNSNFSMFSKQFLPIRSKKINMSNAKYMQHMIYNKSEQQHILTPIELTIILDGIGGVKIGDSFIVDFLPAMYKQNGIFQITSISHAIGKSKWNTELIANYRVFNGLVTSNRRIINNQIATPKPIPIVDTSVIEWIKKELGNYIKIAATQYDINEYILGGICYTEVSNLIKKYFDNGKKTAVEIAENMYGDKRTVAGSPITGYRGYGYFQIDFNTSGYKEWILEGNWKNPRRTTMVAAAILKDKQHKLSKYLSGDDLEIASIAAYNMGEDKVISKLKNKQSVDNINPYYVKKVKTAAESYKNV